jgi:dihydrofolate synthase/folylpolyglutamate synthase
LDYQSTLHYLYSLTDSGKEHTERYARYDPDTLDLSRMMRVVARLGNPHQRFPAIHIAGTKGKGSVAAMCASVLQAAGMRTGLYTSPHLHTFRERIRVDGELIPPEALTTLLQECRPIFDAEPELTTFEAITALAFVYFVKRRVDLAVIEVGLGGRLDATNVITPQVAIITSLSLDHTYLLGDTLADIAREKAGIIKPGVPTVCAPQKPEALAVIERVCAERGSPLTLVGRDWTWELHASADELKSREPTALSKSHNLPLRLSSQSFDLHCSKGSCPLEGTYTIPLLGRHQVNNAVAAVAALELLMHRGVSLDVLYVRDGLANVRWPGRFEILQADPLLVVDCAHNRDSAAKLAVALDEWFPDRRWTFILGASSDKDVTGIVRELAGLAQRILATQSRHTRAMSAQRVAEIALQTCTEVGVPSVEVIAANGVALALDMALNWGDSLRDLESAISARAPHVEGKDIGPICVTGSVFTVAEAREVWAFYSGKNLSDVDFPMDLALFPVDQRPADQMHSMAV